MFRNYLKIAIRNLFKHKVYSFVNIFGLSLGLACSMLMLIYVHHVFSYDRFNEKADQIYRLGREITSAEGERREPLSSAPAAAALRQEYPEVLETVRFKGMGNVIVRYGDTQYYENHMYYADASVFDVFTFPLVTGDQSTALSRPYSLVITQEMAEKYFGDENPLNKVLTLDNSHDFKVTGVMRDLPETTHRKIHMLASFETLVTQNHPDLQDWLSFNYSTYVLLRKEADYKTLESKFPDLIERHIGERTKTLQGTLGFYLYPLKKIYLFSQFDGNPPGLISMVVYYSLMAVLITLIACINFMNLSTARSSTRMKEIGLRKVVGAGRGRLIAQFLTEALLVSLFALVIAFFLVEMLLPSFSTNVEEQLTLSLHGTPGIFIGFLLVTLVVGIIAGSYPAFYLSRYRPVRALKGSQTSGRKKSKTRSALVILQFVLSIVFICQTMLLHYQIRYLKNKDIGFQKKDVLILPIMDENIRQSLPVLKEELLNSPNIVQAASASSLPGLGIPRNVKIPQGYSKNEMQLMDDINVDADFIPTLGITMAAGRNFRENSISDLQNAIIINRLAARKFGWKDPIGKTIQYSVGEDQYATGIVIGVTEDFHLSSMHRVIEPLFISNHPENLHHIFVRIRPGKETETLGFVRTQWSSMYPDHPFQYDFLESQYDIYFRTLEKVLEGLTFFTTIAIVLACLGIFALSTFIAEGHTKEIGIRKVLGDTTTGIVWRLNFELLKHVLISIGFIIPYAYFTHNLLSQFLPYTTKTNYFIYAEASLLVFAVALLSISYQSIKSAMANPVESLRYE